MRRMLSVWWGVYGIYRFELLPNNTTVTAEFSDETSKNAGLADKMSKEHPKLENVCCTITCALTSQRRLPAKFWSSNGPGPERLPPLPIASASSGKEALR
ncbi:hypothetical protein RB195_019585 [Necator americanus]